MVCRSLFEIARAFPEKTPETVWFKHSRGQMMLFLREARRVECHEAAQEAIVTHGAMYAAIANAFGKESPEFVKMVDDLLRDDVTTPREPVAADDTALAELHVIPNSAADELAELREF